jgi:CHAT domain-containing protein/pimeloyl-ACP methyl ester carboxylesterase
MKKAKVYGQRKKIESFEKNISSGIYSDFINVETVELSTTRAPGELIEVEFEDDSIVVLAFDDGTEWIGHPGDIPEIYGPEKKSRSANESFTFEASLTAQDETRGIIKNILIKTLSVLKPKSVAKAAKITGAKLAEDYDAKAQPNPGLYQVDKKFNLIPLQAGSDTSSPYLVLIHGTLSTTLDAFNKLHIGENSIWEQIYSLYKSRVLALEHRTLSVSPVQNAVDFLKACPKGITIDILSHSRGGLVADILAKCDKNNPVIGFSKDEMSIVEGNEQSTYDLMLEINNLAKEKQISIGKVVRVAAPSSGTTILSRRVDHFFNLMLNGIGLALGIRNPLYGVVKSFLLELIAQKADPEVMPGLNSMVPDSYFQKMLNNSNSIVNSELYNISGDAEVGTVSWNSLKVILANLFYLTANDWVVDTNRMSHGVLRANGMYSYLSKDSATNHFNYFGNENTRDAIFQALDASSAKPALLYQHTLLSEGQRGVIFGMFSLEGVHYDNLSGNRDVVILIPGIMGSTLAKNGIDQWVDVRLMNKGAIRENLKINSTNIKASGVIKDYYDNLALHLSKTYDVLTFPFDWRKSLKEAATQLKSRLSDILKHKGIKVHIIAHSMGGLLARQLMIDHAAIWDNFKSNEENKLVLLGTPWLGSYLIMEVLTGDSRRVKQLAMIDFKSNRKELLDVFWDYPGVFELLPIEENSDRNFSTMSFWNSLKQEAKLDEMPDMKDKKNSLSGFSDYYSNTTQFLSKLSKDDFKNVYYICGNDDKTVFDYKLKDRFLSRNKKLVYLATSEGDGSVTWKTGIPKQIDPAHLYYTNITHGELANDSSIFDGISDLLIKGETSRISTQKPVSRAGEIISEVYEYPEPSHNLDAISRALFGISPPKITTSDQTVKVTVINGDLNISSFPVMVGHFHRDAIFSAEKALDGYLEKRLSQRHAIGYYPGKIGESEVFFNLNTKPKGAIICGLGNTNELTPYLLSKTVELATLKYAMFMRDNYTLPRAKKYAHGISFILIAIGYGKLAIEDSARGILLGVANANKYIVNTQEGLQTIKQIEIVNYYESVASEAYWSLNSIKNSDTRIAIDIQKGIVRKPSAKKKRVFKENPYNWWNVLDIESIREVSKENSLEEKIVGLAFNSTSGYARVERQEVRIGYKQIHILLEQVSSTTKLDRKLSKALFELLFPNEFKNIIRNKNNVIFKLDKDAAELPWEMLYDYSSDENPAAVSSGLIRQLVTENSETFVETSISNNDALIIGDPIYGDDRLPQLAAAKFEAERINSKLSSNRYFTDTLINAKSSAIMLKLFTGKYKILHFAGHGLYSPEKGEVGIAIGDGIFIDPAMMKQLGYVPEFVFINCCFSGQIKATDDAHTRDRYKLAANVGTQLIEMGVKAIVIAGWALDDTAAETFSNVFYDRMLDGYEFGRAVQIARTECYQKHLSTNTWGAYQCYGNQFYKFNDRQKLQEDAYEYVISSQVCTDLDNLFVSIRNGKKDRKKDTKWVQQKLSHIMEKTNEGKLLDGTILEWEALIYDELGETDLALHKFNELFKYSNGDFSMKALKQYCTILTYKLDKTNIKEYIPTIENLILIGRNPNRLNIVGNAHKIGAQFAGAAEKIKYLKRAFDYYKLSIELNDDRLNGEYLDAISNLIYIGHLLKLNKDNTLDTCISEGVLFAPYDNIADFLENFSKELEDKKDTDSDLSILIGKAELSFGMLLLTSGDEAKESALMNYVIKQYQDVFQLIYSPRYIKIEIRQVEFIQSFLKPKDKKKIKQLENIKESLQALL